MNEKVAPIGSVIFNIERDLDGQVGAQSLPFPGMDKSSASVCVRHLRGHCDRKQCPFKHLKSDRTIVCKHWLRGLCKKGDSCEFLHQFDMTRMPVCFFFSRYQSCTNKECSFLHIDPNSQIAECSWYERGFCRHGGNCRKKHTRRFPCYNYLCGFCPDGPNCKWVHMKFDIPDTKSLQQPDGSKMEHPNMSQHHPNQHPNSNNNNSNPSNQSGPKQVICNYCREPGHKIYTCTKIPADKRDETIQNYLQNQQKRYNNNNNSNSNSNNNMNNMNNNSNNNKPDGPGGPGQQNNGPNERYFKSLDQVVCFKCGQSGHFANKCPNGFNSYMKNQHNNSNKNFHNNNNPNNNHYNNNNNNNSNNQS